MELTTGRFAAVLILTLAACQEPGPDDRGQDKCANYTGSIIKNVSGTLFGERDLARTISRRLRPLDGLGKDHGEKNGGVRLVPICEQHEISEKKLQRGRFVALLTGPGTFPRFSPVANDTVLWWVYGEKVETDAGNDTTIWHSEFLSMHASASQPYITTAQLHTCPAEGRPDQEEVDWHAGTCHRALGGVRPSGDRPWFGCTRGCCFAAMPGLDDDLSSVPRDSVPPDTTRTRDTTRDTTGA